MFYSKLRVDLDVVVELDVTKIIESISSSYAWVVESPKSHPHIHAYIEHTCSAQHIRKLLRSIGLNGNGSYSLSSLDSQYPLEYLAYMSKEGLLFSVGIPETVLDEAHEYMLKVKDEIKCKRESKRTVLDKIMTSIDPSVLLDTYSNVVTIQEAIITYHLENNLLIRRNQCQVYLDTILCRTQSLNHARCLIFEKRLF